MLGSAPDATLGCHGFTFTGVGRPPSLVESPGSWPSLDVRREVLEDAELLTADDETVSVTIDNERAEVRAGQGTRVLLDRAARTATYLTRSPIADDELAHPYLGLTACYFAGWEGRFVFHTGAFVVDGLAWALLGHREAGKSTLLAHLHLSGHPVLVDDILVVDGGTCFAGPRSVYLRASGAAGLLGPDSSNLPSARDGTRRRLVLPAIAPEVALGGFVYLQWGDRVAMTPVPPAHRLRRLNEHRITRSEHDDPRALLDMTALPAWELTRPRRWSAMPRAADALVETVTPRAAVGG